MNDRPTQLPATTTYRQQPTLTFVRGNSAAALLPKRSVYLPLRIDRAAEWQTGLVLPQQLCCSPRQRLVPVLFTSA